MSPIRIDKVKRVVVDIRHRFLSLDVVLGADIPHRCLRPSDQDQKQAVRDLRLGQIFFGKIVLALPCRTVDQRNAVGFGVTANATAEAAASRIR